MRKIRKKYQGPKHPWKSARINEEIALAREYGFANKREIWKVASLLRKWRAQARKIAGMREGQEERKKTLISKLQKLGILGEEADLDDVLELDLRSVAEKRLQTVVFRQGLASSPKQARQFIVHGKVTVNNECVASPSYLVKAGEKVGHAAGFKPELKPKKKVAGPKVEEKKEVKEEAEMLTPKLEERPVKGSVGTESPKRLREVSEPAGGSDG